MKYDNILITWSSARNNEQRRGEGKGAVVAVASVSLISGPANRLGDSLEFPDSIVELLSSLNFIVP